MYVQFGRSLEYGGGGYGGSSCCPCTGHGGSRKGPPAPGDSRNELSESCEYTGSPEFSRKLFVMVRPSEKDSKHVVH